jgi:hypothetical protein
MTGLARSAADALEARSAELCETALREMYADPFWLARFGERGRRFSREDAQFHVAYLAEAMRSGSAASFVVYIRWLQQVLTTRGMCSLHLSDTLDALAIAVRASGVPDADTALAYLAAGRGALRYDGDAGRVQQLSLPDASDRIAEHLVSYMGDAVALHLPRVFTEHVAWLRENAERVGTTGVRVEEAVTMVLAAVASASPSIGAAAEVVAALPVGA